MLTTGLTESGKGTQILKLDLPGEDLPFISGLRRLREPFVKLQALSRFSHAFIVRKRGYSGTNFHVACVKSGERVS